MRGGWTSDFSRFMRGGVSLRSLYDGGKPSLGGGEKRPRTLVRGPLSAPSRRVRAVISTAQLHRSKPLEYLTTRVRLRTRKGVIRGCRSPRGARPRPPVPAPSRADVAWWLPGSITLSPERKGGPGVSARAPIHEKSQPPTQGLVTTHYRTPLPPSGAIDCGLTPAGRWGRTYPSAAPTLSRVSPFGPSIKFSEGRPSRTRASAPVCAL